jgi:DnaD/phage-associated family protein
MTDFNGFPPGNLKFTAIPDLFFSRLLPHVDDLAELKVVLHIMWLRQRDNKQAIRLTELQADETLINSLKAISDEPYKALSASLKQAVAHNILLTAQVDGEAGEQQLYLLNSEGGRLMLEKLETGEIGLTVVRDLDVVSPRTERANIFQLYEDNIGLISPILSDELKDAEKTYPQEWIEDAFKVAVENNVRKWNYIRAVLERMATEGRDYGTRKQQAQADTARRWFTEEELEHLLKH